MRTSHQHRGKRGRRTEISINVTIATNTIRRSQGRLTVVGEQPTWWFAALRAADICKRIKIAESHGALVARLCLWVLKLCKDDKEQTQMQKRRGGTGIFLLTCKASFTQSARLHEGEEAGGRRMKVRVAEHKLFVIVYPCHWPGEVVDYNTPSSE